MTRTSPDKARTSLTGSVRLIRITWTSPDGVQISLNKVAGLNWMIQTSLG
jgi:hypothetical protein